MRGEGREEPFKGLLAGDAVRVKLPELSPTHEDIRIDRVVAATSRDVIPLERMADVLDALSGCSDVTLDGAAIRASAERVKPRAIVEDAPNGAFVLRVESDPAVSGVVGLGVAKVNGVLRPLGETATTGERLERLPLVRTFSRSEETELVTRVLPELEKTIEVTVRAKRLAKKSVHARPRLEMDLSHQGHTLSVLPLLVYGDPPIARIDGDAVISLGRGGVPLRKVDRERALLQRLRSELDLVVGRRVHFDGAEATRFAARLRDFQDLVGEHEHAAVFDGSVLEARIVIDDEGTFDLVFEHEDAAAASPEGQQEKKRAEPSLVLRAWRDGLDIVPLDGGGWAPLPAGWLAKHGSRVADLLAARDPDTKKLPRASLVDLAALCDALDTPRPVVVDKLAPLIDGLRRHPAGAAAVGPPRDAPRLPDARRRLARVPAWRGARRRARRRHGARQDAADDSARCPPPRHARSSCVRRASSTTGRRRSRASAPAWRSRVYHGPKRALDAGAAVTLTTYAVLRLDAESLAAEAWDTVVLDEAQAIKNESSQTARAAFDLRAPFRLALSGTPVENRLEELWSVMHFANPGLLGGRTSFQDRYASPIATGTATAAERLRAKIRPSFSAA